jgi:hypothetical protein
MTVSDDLARLSVRAKQAEDRAAAAKAQARDQLQQAVQEARDSTQQTADKLRAESAAAADRADNIQRSWDDHLAQARERIDARKARHAADRAETDAEDADSYAAYSIDLAYSAIEEAEYAVLDAVLARQDADKAAGTVAT